MVAASLPSATVGFGAARSHVIGDASGLAIPAHPAALLTGGPELLTALFRAFGTLEEDNGVAEIVSASRFAGGNSGDKLALEVKYARPEPDLHTALFVKFSRDFADPFRDRRRNELSSEVQMAVLSRHPAFPVKMPKPYFADFEATSGTGILITQSIAFGANGIEPLIPKCRDYRLANALEYYGTTISTLSRLAAAHHSGAFGGQVETLFPFDAEASAAQFPIELSEGDLAERIAQISSFAQQCPGVLPAALVNSEFLTRFERDARRIIRHQGLVRRFLHADARFIALEHWNTNLDNAWFWRDATGALRCGLLDWGMARQMNVAYAIWGGLCTAEPDMLVAHAGELLDRFVSEYRDHGGPALPVGQLRLHFDLTVALLGLSLLMDVPHLVLARVPHAAQVKGRRDPMLSEEPVVDGFLQSFINFLSLWQAHEFGSSLDRVLADVE